MKGCGMKGRSMGREEWIMLMEGFMRGNSLIIRNGVWEKLYNKNILMKDILKMIFFMVMEK